MTSLAFHRGWLTLLGLAAALHFGSAPVLDAWRQRETATAKKLVSERAAVKKSLGQLEEDIATARRLADQIGQEDVERLIAPADRLQAAAMLEHQAAALRLQHFAYTLAPEQRTNSGGAQNLVQSDIALAADMPLDADAYYFVRRICESLPGRAALRELTLERIGKTPAALNLHMTARIEWLSNSAAQKMAGDP